MFPPLPGLNLRGPLGDCEPGLACVSDREFQLGSPRMKLSQQKAQQHFSRYCGGCVEYCREQKKQDKSQFGPRVQKQKTLRGGPGTSFARPGLKRPVERMREWQQSSPWKICEGGRFVFKGVCWVSMSVLCTFHSIKAYLQASTSP